MGYIAVMAIKTGLGMRTTIVSPPPVTKPQATECQAVKLTATTFPPAKIPLRTLTPPQSVEDIQMHLTPTQVI